MSQPTAIVYKYVDQQAARKIIANGSLRFGRPSGMNDPFDVYIEDLFNVSLEQLEGQAVADLLDLLLHNPGRFQAFVGADPSQVSRVSTMIGSILPQDRPAHFAAITATLLEEYGEDLAEMRRSLELERQRVIAQFERTAIFCITRNRDNLLMWAHYAQQHRGVVLGFRPDIERDSFLAIAKPVHYTDTRPTFYKPLDEMIAKNLPFTEKMQADFRNALIYSKSSHWSYEEELRIDIPNGVPVEQEATFLNFYPTELVELYLGCRMDQPFRREIMAAAVELNTHVLIFDARLAKESYALAFEPAA